MRIAQTIMYHYIYLQKDDDDDDDVQTCLKRFSRQSNKNINVLTMFIYMSSEYL